MAVRREQKREERLEAITEEDEGDGEGGDFRGQESDSSSALHSVSVQVPSKIREKEPEPVENASKTNPQVKSEFPWLTPLPAIAHISLASIYRSLKQRYHHLSACSSFACSSAPPPLFECAGKPYLWRFSHGVAPLLPSHCTPSARTHRQAEDLRVYASFSLPLSLHCAETRHEAPRRRPRQRR